MDVKEFIKQYNCLNIDSYQNEPVSIDYLLDLFSEYNSDFLALGEIYKAYKFAEALHSDQKRDSGEPYIIHPLSVAIILAHMHADKDTICAGLLHDVIEDTDTTKSNIGMLFNGNIAKLVENVSKLELDEFNNIHKMDNSAYIRKLITSSGLDLETLIIKLADKLHNMRTLDHKKPVKRRSTALETLELFTPLAYRIGSYNIKNELEDLSLKYINEKYYTNTKNKLDEILENRKKDVCHLYVELDEILKSFDINHEIKCSLKNIYGIYKEKNTRLNNLHDLISLQVLVNDIDKCYEVSKIVDSFFRVYEKENKDFIKNPKANMYQSLHKTIYDNSSNYIQLQIRTRNMDKAANYGFAACWDLSGPYAKQDMTKGINKNFSKPIHAIDRMYEDDIEFLKHVKNELLRENNIVVYTPTNEAIELPYGATTIDFAYQIHTDIGNRIDYAIINGEQDILYTQLNDGDVVEIVTSELAYPNDEWLQYIVTTRAYKKINEYLKGEKNKILRK